MVVSQRQGIEHLVPAVSDLVLKYTWKIKKYGKSFSSQEGFDSPPFDLNANGIKTRWNLALRYWKDPTGKRVTNPVVMCLNLLRSRAPEEEQAKIKFQFGVFNCKTNQWDFCSSSRILFYLRKVDKVQSIGYRDLNILDKHLDDSGDLYLQVKMQLVRNETESGSIAQDMEQLLRTGVKSDIRIRCGNEEWPGHSVIIAARSPILSSQIQDNTLDLSWLTEEGAQQLLQYIYTDKVQCKEDTIPALLEAAGLYELHGLKTLCERVLIEVINQDNANVLLSIAHDFNCETLRKAVLAYFEENGDTVDDSAIWRRSEYVCPEIFKLIKEDGLGSSISSSIDSDDTDCSKHSIGQKHNSIDRTEQKVEEVKV
ncbi:speckle-type POZ protein [Bemisia tabaci]